MLQSFASTRDIDSRCPRGNRPTKKKEMDFGGKNKSIDSTPADTSGGKQSSFTQQTSSTQPKKDHRGGPWRGRGQGQDSSITSINATPKKKEIDLSQVDYFHCRKKDYYTNRCLQKKKQESKN